jgi:preprotein translocase subunit SecY
VIPPIFASSLLLMPASVLNFVPITKFPVAVQPYVTWIQGQLQHGQPIFMIAYALLIIFFSFFYTSIVFNPDETAENLRKYGGNLPGIRPGKRPISPRSVCCRNFLPPTRRGQIISAAPRSSSW